MKRLGGCSNGTAAGYVYIRGVIENAVDSKMIRFYFYTFLAATSTDTVLIVLVWC